MATKKDSTAAKKTPGRKAAPENETKSERFVRLAHPRVVKAIKAILTIGNLGSPAYERTQEQVDTITKRLREEIDALEVALDPKRKGSSKEGVNFTL